MKISLHLGNANTKSKETNKQINTETSGYELWHIRNKQKIRGVEAGRGVMTTKMENNDGRAKKNSRTKKTDKLRGDLKSTTEHENQLEAD